VQETVTCPTNLPESFSSIYSIHEEVNACVPDVDGEDKRIVVVCRLAWVDIQLCTEQPLFQQDKRWP
jgi:hypothetical protein